MEEFIVNGPKEDVLPPSCNSFAELMIDSLKRHYNTTLQVCALTNVETTGGQLLNRVHKLTSALRSAGVTSGDAVSISCENRVEFTVVALSALCVGAAVAPTNITYSPDELQHAYSLSKPKIVFASSYLVYNILQVAPKCPFLKYIIVFDGEESEEENVITIVQFQEKFQSNFIKNEDFFVTPVNVKFHTAAILCSSGTTGLPKGVELTHHNLIVSLAHWMHRASTIEDAVRVLAIIPWFHAFGFVTSMTITAFGGTMVVLPRFDNVLFLESIQNHKVTFLFTVPPLLVFLTKDPLVQKYDLSSVRRIMCGAAPLSKELQDEVSTKFNCTVQQGYGLTETTLAVLSQTLESGNKYGSCGVLAPGTSAKVIDIESGKALGPNQQGELCFKGDLMMKGYIGNPGATAGMIDKDGWLHTGDIGYYDEDEHFFVVDRLKELIKYKGFQVPPAELEALLLTHPGVMDCAVIGLPNEDVGELPLAFVVPSLKNKPSKKELIDFVAGKVSYAKRLHGGIEFIDEIPKNPTGKILRRVLRDRVTTLKNKL